MSFDYPFTRYALVNLADDSDASVERVKRYLPENYEISAVTEHDDRPVALVQGRDNGGWTLHDFVIPRLASGFIGAKEIDLTHSVMKGLPV